MPNRVLNRKGARELSSAEMYKVQGAGCLVTTCHDPNGHIFICDVLCEPS